MPGKQGENCKIFYFSNKKSTITIFADIQRTKPIGLSKLKNEEG